MLENKDDNNNNRMEREQNMVSQTESLLKRILIVEQYKYVQMVHNEIELKFTDISRQKVGELSKVDYGNLILRPESDNKLSFNSMESTKMVRQKENNRLSSQRYNHKEKQNEANLTEDIRKLEKYKNDLEREKVELTREIANYKYLVT